MTTLDISAEQSTFIHGNVMFYRGKYLTELALDAITPPPLLGNSAIVDAGTGVEAALYIYDEEEGWIASGGGGGGVTIAYLNANLFTMTFNESVASYTAASTDIDNLTNGRPFRLMNVATANDFTIPSDATLGLSGAPYGQQISGRQKGEGITTVVAGAGVTVVGTPTLACRAQHSSFTCIREGDNYWLVVGDMG